MKKTPIFEGSCTAIVTPYQEGGIDYEKMGQLIDFQAENGTSALVVCGTTGENATQDVDEHAELLRFAHAHNKGRMKLIAGIGSNNTNTALHLGKEAEAVGYDGVLMVTPYYNKTTQAGLVQHFTYVADRVNVPMVLYNVPSRTSIGITADTYKILSEHPNINGTKEASGDFSLFSKTRYLCGDALNVWSGNDDQTVPMIALGAKGIISVAANVIPRAMADLCAAALKGDFQAAQAIHMKYADLFSTLFIETNPIPVKTALNLMGMNVGHLRLPLVDMSEKNLETLKASLRNVGLI
ncbi:MAG: 4-hydroxy-tetrahydrodipicolinate synthase [Oscillospiraceae bacterium]|jgi:4-hydroxy-tetrahydrodipicolinate synthase|nr:4-hydroxy-tetrahydrodipicolinate synthase [Oscillospiraceae bacterium]